MPAEGAPSRAPDAASGHRRATLIAGALALVVVAGAAAYVLATRAGPTASAPPRSSTEASPTAAVSQGPASNSAEQMLVAAVAAARDQSSVHVSLDPGSASGTSLDLTISKSAGGYGVISDDKGTLQVVLTPDTLYVKGSSGDLAARLGARAATIIDDKWLSVPVTSDTVLSDVTALSSYDQVISRLVSPSSSATKGQYRAVTGVPAVALVTPQGTMWVATAGGALPLLVERNGSAGGRAVFSHWSEPVHPPVPPADQVISIAQVRSLTGSATP